MLIAIISTTLKRLFNGDDERDIVHDVGCYLLSHGGVDGFGPWWESVLAQLDLVADDLLGLITDAQDITVSFPDLPFDLEEFYTLLDFLEYLAQQAASEALSNAADPFEIDMRRLHSGATYALSNPSGKGR